MRFDQLLIEKYGVYSSKSINLTATPGLTVLYGPNEAGKSTTLSAVVDLLYGIPTRTSRAQVFGGPAIALTAHLRLADGSSLKLKRTKGNTRTLTDGDGVSLDDSVLTPYLGANNRERFLALFALNHESLRSGGEQLLDAKGDIGRLIIEAGGGLRSLAAEMAGLAERADSLYGTRKSDKRLFYVELDRYQEADRQVKAGLLTVDAYERAHKASRAATKRLEELRAQLLAVREAHRSLERMARVCPLMHELERYRDALTVFDDLPVVSPGFSTQVREIQAAHKEADAALSAAESAMAGVNAQIDAVQVSQQILDAEAAIVDIAEAALHVSKERTDRSGRVTELAKSQAMLDGLRRLTGLPLETDIAPLMPSPIDLARVRALASQAATLNAEIRTVERQIKDAQVQVTRLRAHLAEREAGGSHLPLGFDAVRFANLDVQYRDVERKRGEIERTRKEIERATAALGFESIDLLTALRIPDEADIQNEIDRSMERARARQVQEDVVTLHTQRKSLRAAEIALLRTGGEIPTKGAIQTARNHRTSAFEPIKKVYLAEVQSAVSEVPLEDRAAAVRHLEEITDSADRLVDRTSEEAGRIAAVNLAQQELAEAEVTIVNAKQEIENMERACAAAAESWALRWPDAAKSNLEPQALKVFALGRSEVLSRSKLLAELVLVTDQLDTVVQSTTEALTLAEERLGTHSGDSPGINARILAVTQRAKVQEADFADYRASLKSLSDAVAKHAREEQRLSELREEQEAWQAKWTPLMTNLRVTGDTSCESASDIAAKWSEATGVVTTIALTQQRLTKMDRDEQRLREKIEAVSPLLVDALPTDVVAASEMLKRRLDETKKLQNTRNGLKQQLVALTPAREKALRDIGAAESGVAALCAAGACDAINLSDLATRLEERGVCLDQIRQTEHTLNASGDQLPVVLLREQLDGRELDQISAALAEEIEREKALQADLEIAVKEEERLRQELAGFAAGDDINRPVAARESAAAALRQVVSDYLELVLAKELIEDAMAAVREEQQDPLLARAGALFQQTTIGAFSGIRADVDDQGRPAVVGLRAATGERVALDAMSDGTRDQLFLAFRAAAVEQYCASAEPLPFIADDLLVHFDDGRSLAALELLAELGRTTQVLLFTHHAQVKNDAEKIGVRTINLDRS